MSERSGWESRSVAPGRSDKGRDVTVGPSDVLSERARGQEGKEGLSLGLGHGGSTGERRKGDALPAQLWTCGGCYVIKHMSAAAKPATPRREAGAYLQLLVAGIDIPQEVVQPALVVERLACEDLRGRHRSVGVEPARHTMPTHGTLAGALGAARMLHARSKGTYRRELPRERVHGPRGAAAVVGLALRVDELHGRARRHRQALPRRALGRTAVVRLWEWRREAVTPWERRSCPFPECFAIKQWVQTQPDAPRAGPLRLCTGSGVQGAAGPWCASRASHTQCPRAGAACRRCQAGSHSQTGGENEGQGVSSLHRHVEATGDRGRRTRSKMGGAATSDKRSAWGSVERVGSVCI